MEITFQSGIYLPELDLWLDATRVKERAVVSHAHGDHVARHKAFIVTPGTASLVRHRYRARGRMHTQEFGETVDHGAYSLTLFPAGHVLGSAQALISSRGHRLLYSGDLKLSPSRTAEPCETPEADTLIVESTFGRPRYCFPDQELVRQEMLAFCRAVLNRGGTPVLFAYSLGKAQEVLHALSDASLPIFLHPTVHEISGVYTSLGTNFPKHALLPDTEVRDHVIVAPPQFQRSAAFARLHRPCTAMVTGWAVDPRARYRYRVDAAFPLSDHADYNDLVEYVRRVNPKRVFTVYGFAAEFAADLRSRGYDAQPLEGAMQLQFPAASNR